MFKALFLILMIVSSMAAAVANQPIPLWPNGVPGPKQDLGLEKNMTTPKDGTPGGKLVIRIGNITQPTLTFFPATNKKNAPAVLVFPGGGYRILAYDLEGTEICEWLNSVGVSAVLVKYRVPEPAGIERYIEPLQDAQRAVGLVRSRAEEWSLNPKQIGVLGFSAGGHLAAVMSGNFEKRSYDNVDAADDLSCRPDFTVLIYPAYIAAGENLSELAPEVHVTAASPPAFLVQTEDDPVHVENSLVYYRALKNAKVTAEMHIFATGGHGYGMRPDANKPVTEWPKLAETWLKRLTN